MDREQSYQHCAQHIQHGTSAAAVWRSRDQCQVSSAFYLFLVWCSILSEHKKNQENEVEGTVNFLEYVTKNELLQAACSVVVFCFPDFDMHVCNLEALLQCRRVLLQSS